MMKSWIVGWRTLIVQLAMVGSITAVALLTQSVELVTATGGVFVVITGANVYGKKTAGEQEIKRRNGGG
jgi:hypothetical protein